MTDERETEAITESGLDSNEPADADAPRRGVTWKRVASAIVSLIIIVGIFYFVMPLIADYDEVFRTIGDMTTLEIVSLVLIGSPPRRKRRSPAYRSGPPDARPAR